MPYQSVIQIRSRTDIIYIGTFGVDNISVILFHKIEKAIISDSFSLVGAHGFEPRTPPIVSECSEPAQNLKKELIISF